MPLQAIHRFLPLFSFGVGIDATAGMTLPSLLCDRLGIAREYIDQRVQTIFVNSRAVDRPDQVVLHSGDKIALSAAMPGLAGATLRREGLLAAFRQDITYKDGGLSSDEQQSIVVTLKLFNQWPRNCQPICCSLVYGSRAMKLKGISRHMMMPPFPHSRQSPGTVIQCCPISCGNCAGRAIRSF